MIGGHGPDFQHLIPANKISYPQRMGKIMTASDDGAETARDIVRAYADGQISMEEMLHAVVQRLHETANDPPEEYDRDDNVAHPEDPVMALRVAVRLEKISEEEYEHAMSVLRPIIFGEKE